MALGPGPSALTGFEMVGQVLNMTERARKRRMSPDSPVCVCSLRRCTSP
jgi:hypothetical protein